MGLSYWFIPHTHWDREWYMSFQDFRWKLVASIDSVIDVLRTDPRFPHFMLDGQTILIEDYLELRPEREVDLRALISAGRLGVGPWYVQPDDILVTAEALIRNLERGLRLARAQGGAMEVGYLPDSFGHCAALPGVLNGFGIRSAALMRGGGPELDKVFFHWDGPDGSRVLVSYLVDSYGNGADLLMSPGALREGLETLRDRQAQALLPGVPLLVMNGMDHRGINPDLPAAIEAAGLGSCSTIGSLAEYVATAQAGLPRIPEWRGELRSPWRFPVTPGCTSSRSWIKQEDQAVSALLEREAEPLAAMAAWRGAAYPSAALDLAWKFLLQNQPHDSICGCSIDEVHQDMRYRYAQARGLARNIAADAARAVARQVDTSFAGPGAVVAVALNAGPARSHALLEFAAADLPVDPVLVDRDGRRVAAQALSREGGSAVFFDEHFTPRQLKLAMGMVREGRLMEFVVQDARASWESPSVLRVDLQLSSGGVAGFDWNAWVRETRPLLDRPGLAKVHAVGMRSGARSVLFSADLPSFAARALRLASVSSLPPPSVEPDAPAVRAGRGVIENGRFLIRVKRDGSLDVQDRKTGVRLTGVNRIVDAGDRGDEYSYDPPPVDRRISRPARRPLLRRPRTTVVESGPVRATLRIPGTYRLPRGIRPDRKGRDRRTVKVEVLRFVSLTAGGDRIELRTEIDNQARDHRMRVHVPLPDPAGGKPAEESLAGGTFGAVRRPVSPPPWPAGLARPASPELGDEQPAPTHPFTGFVSAAAGGASVAILSRGLREYEIVGGREIAVTLFRSVGWLSRGDLGSRRGNAGPDTPTPGAQEIGRRALEYALLIRRGAASEAELSRQWEDYRSTPPVIVTTAGPGRMPDGESFLEVPDPGLVFSSFRQVRNGTFALRVFDAAGTARSAAVPVRGCVTAARLTRLDGTPIHELPVEAVDGRSTMSVPIGAGQIVTVELDLASARDGDTIGDAG